MMTDYLKYGLTTRPTSVPRCETSTGRGPVFRLLHKREMESPVFTLSFEHKKENRKEKHKNTKV